MQTMAKKIAAHVAQSPEGMPISAKGLLALGNRAAVDQALSRLARRGTLIRIRRGIYVRPIATRFGRRAPSIGRLIERFARERGVTIARHGSAAANELGLTTQVPVRSVYLTSGRSGRLKLGAQTIELQHAPSWQLSKPGKRAGEAIRAIAYLGPERVGDVLARLTKSERREVAALCPQLPERFAERVSAYVANA